LSLSKTTIINDPIYGFITIPNGIVFNLIQHKYFQRLRRISQMGLSYLVGVTISEEEKEGVLIAILLHDIGHGPFSHAMEHSIVEGVNHEHLSLLFMETLNEEFNGSLTLAIEIFKGTYHRAFLNQLVSSQLDMDRTDYLKRDSFYTGVTEGNINTERILAMLNVKDNRLVVEEKGIYTVEKFLIARRLMYWQVYLHKTSIVAEQLITRHKIDIKTVKDSLDVFAQLDDYDIISSMKEWCHHEDFVLSTLSNSVINRKLLKVKVKKKPFSKGKIKEHTEALMNKYDLTEHEASYFIFTGVVSNQVYNFDEGGIHILYKNGNTLDFIKASDQFSLKSLTKKVIKNYMCYPKVKD